MASYAQKFIVPFTKAADYITKSYQSEKVAPSSTAGQNFVSVNDSRWCDVGIEQSEYDGIDPPEGECVHSSGSEDLPFEVREAEKTIQGSPEKSPEQLAQELVDAVYARDAHIIKNEQAPDSVRKLLEQLRLHTMNQPRYAALTKRIDDLLELDLPADPTGWMRFKLAKDMLFPTRSAEALLMSGANPLEGLVHNPVTCVTLSSHAVQYIMPFAVVICTMAGFANEKNTDIELNTVARLQKYREAFRDIIVGDAQVMKGLACMTKPLS